MRRVGELHGTVDVPGAKNSVLKLMAATILADGEYELTNVPRIVDVQIMGELLDAIGIRSWSPAPGVLRLANDGALTPVAPYELVERIRASINVLGPLLTRCGRVSRRSRCVRTIAPIMATSSTRPAASKMKR